MDLVEVYVIGAETLQAVVELGEYGFAGEAVAVGAWAHDAPDFGGDDDFVAGREITDGSA